MFTKLVIIGAIIGGMKMSGVNGRVTIVTGAGRGIGLATAKLLAARGAKVMAVARSETQLHASGLDYVVADLGTPVGCKLAVEETRKRFGPIEILAHVGGPRPAKRQPVC